MNYSRQAERLVMLTALGLTSQELEIFGVNPKTLTRLVRAGIIERTPLLPIGRGHPGFLYTAVGPAPARKITPRSPRKTPLIDAIMSAIGSGELGIGDIAEILGRPSRDISSALLRMCESGILVRRRVGGEISGDTRKRDFYLYRRKKLK